MSEQRYSTTQFGYVYVVYYLDPTQEGYKILHDHGMMVCTTLRRALLVAEQHGATSVREINLGRMWQAGNYWVERQAIIDSDEVGIEFEITEHGGNHKHVIGSIPLELKGTP